VPDIRRRNLGGEIGLELGDHRRNSGPGAQRAGCLQLDSWAAPAIAAQQRLEGASDERVQPFIDHGRELFTRRQGQINLSCSHCHDDNWGKRVAGAFLPQGHPNGYPIYRLEWQSVGSLQRRLRNCLFGLRAELYAYELQNCQSVRAAFTRLPVEKHRPCGYLL
jgi:cytochrome c